MAVLEVLADGVMAVDFEQPRALYTKVFDDAAREALVNNIAGHFGAVKSAEIKARQRESPYSLSTLMIRMLTSLRVVSVWAAVDQSLSDRIAKAIGAPTVKPLQVGSADSAVKYKSNLQQ